MSSTITPSTSRRNSTRRLKLGLVSSMALILQ
jgi:hypothetical protein